MNMQTTLLHPIQFAKTLYHGARHIADKRSQERLIRHFDQRTVFAAVEPLDQLAAKGWAQTDSASVFGRSVAELVHADAALVLPPLDRMGNAISRSFSAELIEVILSSKVLVDVVKGYLGEGARLDDLYLWQKDHDQQSAFDISEGWHTDNVGNRLKMFVCIEASEDAPSTLIVEGTHRRPYRVSVSEFTRFFGKVGEPGQGEPVVEIRYRPDAIALFDTNAVHRGRYQATRASRTCLILEFIDRHKGDLLSGVCPCGPGQSPDGRVMFPETLWAQLIAHPLVDERLLRHEQDGASYSIANMVAHA